eukprot:snap_masked-scaffold_45-processed-gene-0.10-mRNA-1 protein AED:1.00 eAED:1.00 QI:0/0/0/0/1/1/2/0/78
MRLDTSMTFSVHELFPNFEDRKRLCPRDTEEISILYPKKLSQLCIYMDLTQSIMKTRIFKICANVLRSPLRLACSQLD